jgi:hypothetical protein
MGSAFFSSYLDSWPQKLLEHVQYSFIYTGIRRNGVANDLNITSIVENYPHLPCFSLQTTTIQAACFLAGAIHIPINSSNIPRQDLHNSLEPLLNGGFT